MSGHSKWNTIKRKKAKVDAQRGKVFTKVIREIVAAAREGGGDLESNPRLRQAVQSARESNMPAANVERAIKRGTGELPGVSYESCTFEGYAPGGVAVLVESLTDNRKRTSAEIRHLFTKYGGHLGAPNSVSYIFASKGVIVIDAAEVNEERLLELALENGAEDVRSEGDTFEIVCAPEDFERLRRSIGDAGIAWQAAEISRYPATTVKLDRDHASTVLRLVSALEDNDDVQSVSSNFDIPDDILRELEGEL